MSKVFDTSTTHIISSNNSSTIETQEQRDILTNSGYREVVEKGYLLSNIALTSVPDIIQDAINQAKLDAKDLALADAILTNLKDRIGTLEDGVYTKTYIDNTLSYLETVISQKASPESVAQIADARLALATENFATTSQVSNLTSRVESSESSISSLSETINTKDTARATQINEVEATINDSLAKYSEAIDMTIDENGNAKAQVVEDLRVKVDTDKGELELAITETNEAIANVDGSWKAGSSKFITNPNGAITGYSFVDGSGSTSNFTINADSFKISDSTNSYTPFSISNGAISFNGKVSFSANPNIATKEDLLDLASIELVPDATNDEEVELIQMGRNISVVGDVIYDEQVPLNNEDGSSINDNRLQKFTTKIPYSDGCIFSWNYSKYDYFNNTRTVDASYIKVIDVDTNNVVMSLGYAIFFGGIISGFAGDDFYLEGYEDKYFTENPNATAEDFETHCNLIFTSDGEFRSLENNNIYASFSFIYDNAKMSLFEDGIERYSVDTSSGRKFKVQIEFAALVWGSEEVEIDGVTKYKLNFSSSLYVNKWDRYYNNTNLVSEIQDLSQTVTNLSSTTANQILNQNNLLIQEAQERANQDAQIDGRITQEEQDRIDALSTLETEYKSYSTILMKALADEVITPAEQLEINEAWANVQAARNRVTNLDSRVAITESLIQDLDANLADKSLEIASLDNKITDEENARINAINQETQARINAINQRIAEDAALDGKITQAEQNRIDAINDVSSAYKNYVSVVSKAMADGVLTTEEQALISEAQANVNLAKARFDSLENGLANIQSDLAEVNTSLSANALEIASLDGKIDTKEAELINSINAEATQRVADIQERINKEILLDEKITDAEQSILDKASELTLAYQNYADTVAQALIDGEITQAEANAILEAQNRIDSAKTELNSTISTLENSLTTQINSINTDLTNNALSISNLDGKIDTKEAELIASINAEQQARATAIAERISEEARLDGLITAEEQARIDSANALTTAYQNYTDTVKQALIDGEITQAEQNAIIEAQNRVNTAKAQLETQINNLTKVEDISWQTEVQNAVNDNTFSIDGGKIVASELMINNINALGGIQADSIKANFLDGITIKGAYIEGSVIKASYLDLDGDLQLFTSWGGVTNSTYTASPSTYPDLAYDTGTGYWRAATLSIVRETNTSLNIGTNGSTITGVIRSYNSYDTGSLIKARYETPTISLTSYTLKDLVYANCGTLNVFQNYNLPSGYTDIFRIGIGGESVTIRGRFNRNNIWDDGGGTDYSDVYLYVDGSEVSHHGTSVYGGDAAVSTTFYDFIIKGLPLKLYIHSSGEFKCSLNLSSATTLSSPFNNVLAPLMTLKNEGSKSGIDYISCTGHITSDIFIDNMQ